jgi:hypothetical protein
LLTQKSDELSITTQPTRALSFLMLRAKAQHWTDSAGKGFLGLLDPSRAILTVWHRFEHLIIQGGTSFWGQFPVFSGDFDISLRVV